MNCLQLKGLNENPKVRVYPDIPITRNMDSDRLFWIVLMINHNSVVPAFSIIFLIIVLDSHLTHEPPDTAIFVQFIITHVRTVMCVARQAHVYR